VLPVGQSITPTYIKNQTHKARKLIILDLAKLEILNLLLTIFYVFLILSSSFFLLRRKKPMNSVERITHVSSLIGCAIGVIGIMFLPIDINYRATIIIVITIIVGLGISWEKINGNHVTKKLGHPVLVRSGIQYYLSRDDLPFDEAISNAKEKIGFLSISHIIATQEKFDVMRGAIIRGLEITILLLDSNSSVIPQLQSNFKKSTTDLKNDIETSKKLLNEIKLELPEDKKKLLIIKEYDYDVGYSIMVVDPESNNAWIKMEEYPRNIKASERVNKAVFKQDNIDYYKPIYETFKQIDRSARII